MPVLVVIPARLGSTRLPRKPLQPLGGIPLVVRVAEQVGAHGVADRIVVATDADEIRAAVQAAGQEAVLTSPHHQSGTDRVNEVASRAEFLGYDEILNVQGDAPFIPLAALTGALGQLREGFDLGTAAVPLDPAEASNRSRVKVVTDRTGRAVQFSRSRPAQSADDRYWEHLGVYAYTRGALRRVAHAPPTARERAEGLEQLRAMELGLSIGVALLAEPAGPAVDSAEDLREAQAFWNLSYEATR